jgi:hypothetical protein
MPDDGPSEPKHEAFVEQDIKNFEALTVNTVLQNVAAQPDEF